MFYFDDYDIENFDDYAIEELTEITERLNRIAGQYKFGTEEFSFFVGLGDLIEKPLRIRKDNKMINNFEELKTKVEEWAKDKDLLHEENADKQFMKFIEEVFEFKTEMDIWKLYKKFKYDENIEQDFSIEEVERWKNLKLEMGDIFVTLIILCNQLGIDCVECLQLAYDKISKRKGKTIDGIFYREDK